MAALHAILGGKGVRGKGCDSRIEGKPTQQCVTELSSAPYEYVLDSAGLAFQS